MKDSAFRSAAYEDFTQNPDPEPDWPDPLALDSELPPVEPLHLELLPDALGPLVLDTAERMQVPFDFPAAALVLCLAGATNRRARIRPKEHDAGWQVVPNLWGGIVAAPGLLKSPVIAEATRSLQRIESGWRHDHEQALADHKRRVEEFDLQQAVWREKYKRAVRDNKVAPNRPTEEPPAEPSPKRLVVNDGTLEALHQVMSHNPAGLLVLRDELTGWWSQLDRHGREGERAFFLECWNGTTGFTLDRIGRGVIHVEACCLSMLGGIQPGRLRGYLTEALRDGPSNDGLIQRFQVLVWPDCQGGWKYIDRPPDYQAEVRLFEVFRRIAALDPDNPVQFRFDPAAQRLFIDWLAELERKVRGDHEHPALISHLAKYRSLMPTLAGLFELADLAAGGFVGFDGSASVKIQNISLSNTRRAAAWTEYLESHARRVYSCVVTPQVRGANELARRIQEGRVGTRGGVVGKVGTERVVFTERQVYLKGWSGLDTPEAVRSAAEILVDSYWLRVVDNNCGPMGGRPSPRYAVNPKVYQNEQP